MAYNKSMKHSSAKIIGRLKEKEILQDQFESNKAEFIAVYGRRRVGKTYLIKNFMESLPCIFFHVTGIQNGTLNEQLEEFSMQHGKTFYPGAKISPQSRWRDAFEDLTQAISRIPKHQKIVLFFDEFPWMSTPRSNLLKALELYWNRYWVFDDRIKLIICGSSTSWVIDKIINNRGGLHNRVTCTLQLLPFSLHETECYLNENKIKLERRQILDLYTAFGGVPLYWSYVKKGQSSHQNIDRLCFQHDGPLVGEFKRLFDSLFEDPKPFVDLIRIIAKHRYGIGQAALIAKSGLPDGGRTVTWLSQLEDAGFITSIVPFGHKDKGKYYTVDDEYSLFYLAWIEPNLKTINKQAKGKGFWLSLCQRPNWKSWAGYAFESICYKHIVQIRHALKIDPGAHPNTWRYVPRTKSKDEGAQIDLLFDRPDNSITICEIKCSDTPFAIDKSYAQELRRKLDVFKKQTRIQKQLFLVMITTFGLKPTLYSEELITDQVTLDALFKEVE